MTGLQADRSDRWFAGSPTILGHLKPVVDRVADQVIEGRLEPVKDVAVDTGGLADDLEPRLLAELARQVTDHTRKASDAVGQRPHSAGQHFVVQSAGKAFTDAGKLFECFDRLAQLLQSLIRLRLRAG